MGLKMTKIKAIIFDCYGVLVDDAMPAFIEEHVSDEETKRQIWEADDAVNRSEKSVAEFFAFLAGTVGMSAREVTRILDANTINKQLFDYIRNELKPHYNIAILSNISGDILDELIGKDNRALFDVETLSYKVGAVKPQPEIYHYCLERLDFDAEQCVFIDDKERYCDAARSMGMHTIRYRNFEEFKKSLEEVLTHEN